eukprot:g379.t1
MTNYAQLSIYTKRGKPSPRHIRFVVLGIVIFWGSVGYSSFYAEPLEEVVVAAAAAAAAASSSTSFPPTSPSSPSMLTIVGAPATALSPSTSTSSPHPAGSGTSSSSSSPRKVLLSWFYPLLGTWLLIFSVFAGQQLMSTRSARRVWEPLLLFDLVCLLVSCVLLVTAGNCIFDYFGYLEAEPWIMGGRGLQQQGSRSSTSSGTSAAAAGEQVEVQAADQRVVGAAVPVVGVGVTKLMNIARVVRLQYQLSLFEVFEITCVIAAKKFRLPVGLLNIYVKTMLMWAWFLAARHLLLCAEEEILRRKPTTESTVLTFFEEVPEFAASASHMILILFVTNIFSAVAYSYYIASMLMAKEKDRRRGREVCCSCRALFTRLIRVCNEFVLLHFPSMQLAQHLSLFSHAVFQLAAYCVRELFYVNVQHFPTASSLGLFNITNPVVPFLELLVCSQLLLLYVDFNVHDEKAEAEHEVEPAPSRHWDQERAEEQEQQPLQERTGGVAVADHNEAPGCCSRILSDEEGRDPEPRFCFSFDSCGWLYVYHWGVASFVHDHFDGSGNYPPELAFSGASGGALVAGCMALRLDPMAVGLDSVRQSEPCQYSVFETFRLCDKTLDKWVPENVHHVNGKLRVLMTKLSFWKPPFAKGQVVTRFFSRKHMIQCLRASSHIPLLAGWLPYYIDQYKGYFIDGLMWLTLFVHWRAFSPTDYITRVSATGIYPNADLRPKKCFPFWWALFPPDEEVLEGMFWQGYVDAMTFFHPDGVRSTGASGSGASGSVRGGDELLGDMNRRRERGSSLCSCRSPAPRTGRVSGAGGQKAFGRAGAEGAGGRGATHRRSAPGAGARGSGGNRAGKGGRKGRFRDPRLHDVEHDFACEHDSAPRPSHRRVLSAPEKFRELPTEKPFCKYSDGTKEQQAEIRRLILLADQQIEVSWVYAIMFALLLVLLVLAQ